MKKANVSKPENFEKLKEYAANMKGYSLTDTAIVPNNTNRLTPVNSETIFSKDTVPLDCASVYPMYLSVMDKENAKKNSKVNSRKKPKKNSIKNSSIIQKEFKTEIKKK